MWYDSKGNPTVEEDDQCATCKHFRLANCPLLLALVEKQVVFASEGGLKTVSCPMYKDHTKYLKAVK